ncbi:hypothetical protein DN409_04665 [Bacillus mycoides]|nr:hypothetical protein DN409_04665 [Bacillus mycoides]
MVKKLHTWCLNLLLHKTLSLILQMENKGQTKTTPIESNTDIFLSSSSLTKINLFSKLISLINYQGVLNINILYPLISAHSEY